MVRIPRSPDYDAYNAQAYGDGYLPCCICGKAVAEATARFWVHMHGGGDVLVTQAEAAAINRGELVPEWRGDASDLGAQVIGSCCMGRHPELAPYVIDRDAAQACDDLQVHVDGVLTTDGHGDIGVESLGADGVAIAISWRGLDGDAGYAKVTIADPDWARAFAKQIVDVAGRVSVAQAEERLGDRLAAGMRRAISDREQADQ